ncbi:hypothetical protein [Bosea beijingensis]|uniref:hypothetical protein n=1 Tax=Bosea beijingensis TaxID=3068632 RepID=UPI00274297D2|nr:hypothetical protein [Bosea sp. REN20]
MTGAAGRMNWRRSAIALVAVYVLILQTTLVALAAGLSAQPSSGLLHPLCAPGQTAPVDPTPDSGGAKLPDCCSTLCLSGATALPPPSPATVPVAREPARSLVRNLPAEQVSSPSAPGYPLGARAPPVLA